MAKKRRPLTEEEQADARRLEAVWLRQKRALGLTQEEASARCGWTTQGAFSQYLRGVIPLNVTAAIKIARALNVDVSEFSPRLASFLPTAPGGVNEEPARYPAEEQTPQDPRRAAWNRLFDELEREGMVDMVLRLVKLIISDLRHKDAPPAPTSSPKKQKVR